MDVRWKRSLVGYDPEQVETEIDSIDWELEKEYKKLNDELKKAEIEMEDLKEKLKEMEDGSLIGDSMENEIGKKLLRAHMDSSSAVYESIKRYKAMQREKMQVIGSYKKKCEELDDKIKKMMDGMQTIVNE